MSGTHGTTGSTTESEGPRLIVRELARTSSMRKSTAAAAIDDPYQDDPNAVCEEVGLDVPVSELRGLDDKRPSPEWLWVRVPAEHLPSDAREVRSFTPSHRALGEPDPAVVASAANALLRAVTPIADAIATRVIGLVPQQARPSPEVSPSATHGTPTGGLSDDAYVDQRSGLFDRQMYLRLARKGAFPVKKIGKRIVARWGDVKAALQPLPVPATVHPHPVQPPDELDQLRSVMGLARNPRKRG